MRTATGTGAGTYRIGEVAGAAGLSVDCVRYYERMGLLERPGRSDGGFRRYPRATLQRLRVIRAAKQAGFKLRELADIFAERRAGRAPCERVRALAAQKLEAVDAEMRRLQRLRRALERTLGDWDARLRGRAPGQMAGLLDALAASMDGAR